MDIQLIQIHKGMKKKLQMTMQTHENTQFERKHFSVNKKKHFLKKTSKIQKI